jgi:site-specific DNA recombinase
MSRVRLMKAGGLCGIGFDDGGLSGASLERPALQELLDQVRGRKIDVIVVYRVDRLTRSLADFAKLVELFDAHQVSFVSVTRSFNTTSSMGRLTLNVLLSFAQFEREVIGERVRDKIAASKRKRIWVGGPVPLGYRSKAKKLEVPPEQAALVRKIFTDYLRLGSIGELAAELDRQGIRPKPRALSNGATIAAERSAWRIFSRTASISAGSSIAAKRIRANIDRSSRRSYQLDSLPCPRYC